MWTIEGHVRYAAWFGSNSMYKGEPYLQHLRYSLQHFTCLLQHLTCLLQHLAYSLKQLQHFIIFLLFVELTAQEIIHTYSKIILLAQHARSRIY
jgi:hypothetical protein